MFGYKFNEKSIVIISKSVENKKQIRNPKLKRNMTFIATTLRRNHTFRANASSAGTRQHMKDAGPYGSQSSHATHSAGTADDYHAETIEMYKLLVLTAIALQPKL